MVMLDKTNLLVLCHTYNSFIKDPIEIISKEFNKIFVLVRYKPIAELANIIPLPFFLDYHSSITSRPS
ncbi:unnamed protein product, partial [marine sediment metagenome]